MIPEESAFFDFNVHADVNQDLEEENVFMYMVFTILFLFLVSVIYNVVVTLIKVRYARLTIQCEYKTIQQIPNDFLIFFPPFRSNDDEHKDMMITILGPGLDFYF